MARRPVVARAFEPEPANVALARAFVDRALAGCDASTRETAVFMANELVTNALRHADTAFEVTVQISVGGSPRIQVIDGDPRLPPFPGPASLQATGGRGLWLVEQLASAWGAERHGDGKSVWFEVTQPMLA